MGSTVDKINKSMQTKADIKSAIEAKGVVVGNIPYSQYPTKIAEISGGGSTHETYEQVLTRMRILLDECLARNTGYKAGNIFAFRNYSWIQGIYRTNNNTGGKAWEIGGVLYSAIPDNYIFNKVIDDFSDLGYIDCEGYNYKYVIVLFDNNTVINDTYHCFYEFPMIKMDNNPTNNNGNLNLFRFVACKNVPICFSYVDTPDLIAIDGTGSIPKIDISTGYGWRGSMCEFMKGINFTNFTGRYDFSNLAIVKNITNLTNFQCQSYAYQITTNSLINMLDALIDTKASPKNQGVGNSYNLRKLQATQDGLDAIARAEAKGYTITANTQ